MPSVKNDELVIARGQGAYVWDTEGRRLLDAPAGLWNCNVGHGRAEIGRAVAEQMAQLETYSTFGRYCTVPALTLAERLAEMVPVDGAKFFFGSGGSDAVETAAKLAVRYWSALGRPEKKMIVSRDAAYHGLHGIGTSITGIDSNREGFGALVEATARISATDASALSAFLDAHSGEVAAFFCEPIIGTGGVIPPPPGYLAAVQQACLAHDVLFVVDEVITGFGRTGSTFASDRYDLRPDILLIAKGITSGYLPLGAAVVSARVAEPFWVDGSELVFRHGLTYAGHAAACAAAHANLDILEREDLVKHVDALAPTLRSLFEPLADHPAVIDVRVADGLLAGVQLANAASADDVVRHCLDHGVVARLIANHTLQISPPFVVEDTELATLAEVVFDALERLVRTPAARSSDVGGIRT